MTVGGPSAPNSEDPLIDRVLSDRYRILRKLGEGGMGVVYLAEHVVIEKKIALKVLFPDLTRRSDLVQRFLQEAKSASRINHENVIDITDFGQSPEGYVFIAMEYLVGQDLGQLLKASGPLPWLRAQPIILQITKALRAAHERGIVHRDIKPENIFVSPRDDGREFVKVLDFGIAKVLGLDDDAPRLTRTGMIFGTPEYMSPEQAQGQQVDHRVDIYAVGCILYHMLTGEVPFQAESFMGILSKHMLETPVAPSTRNPGIEPAVEAVITRAMEKNPAARFQTMEEFVGALAPLGYVPDKSGAVSMSTGMPAHRTGMPSRSPAVSTAPARETGVATTSPEALATSEISGPVGIPLTPSNPEARRSQTEIFAREERTGSHRFAAGRGAGSTASRIRVVLGASAGALVLFAILFLVFRGGAPSGPPLSPLGTQHAAPPTAAAAMLRELPTVDRAKSAGSAAADGPAAAASHGVVRKGKENGRTRRGSREAVDSLFVPSPLPSQPGETPPSATKPGRTPNELKNPFAVP